MTTGELPAQMKRESQAKHRAELAEQAKRDHLDREICQCPKPLRCGCCGWMEDAPHVGRDLPAA